MNEISVINIKTFRPELVLLRETLGEHLCKWYCPVSFKEKKLAKNNNRIVGSVIPFLFQFFVGKMGQYHLIPPYWSWWSLHIVLDLIFCNKIAKDESKIIYVPTPCKRTIKKAQRLGKKVVLLAANSEPRREYERISKEYDLFSIKNRYIYGNKKYEFDSADTLRKADYMINITEVSKKTYENAGYDMSKSHLILDTGTNFPIQPFDSIKGKEKVFITTAFHSFIKGTHRLLMAWKKAGIKDVPLIIAGRLCSDMEEFVKKNGPFDNVVFLGHCSNLQERYKNYDAVGIILSLSEGSGRVTPEMMSFGFPMITSPDAVCDLINDGYNGVVVDPTNEDAIVKALRYFYDDWGRVHAMRQHVLDSVSSRKIDDYATEIAKYLISLI